MLDPAGWQHYTQGLRPGGSRRVDHDCGPGRTLRVSQEHDGSFKAWCFRCGELGVIEAPAQSLSDRLAALEAQRSAEVVASSSVELPLPADTDPHAGGWPLAARVWLYKAGLSNDDIMRLGAYYHKPTDRVVLPVYSGGQLVYWQGRDCNWTRASRRPKYINPEVNKSHLCAKYGTGPVIVLTEDILSAFRVSRVTEAWSLMGTALAPGVLADLITQNKPVVAMFDPDAGGQKANTAALKKLALLGVPFRIARPERDPKYLTKEQTCALIFST